MNSLQIILLSPSPYTSRTRPHLTQTFSPPFVMEPSAMVYMWISDSGNYPSNACNYMTIESGVTYTSIGSTGRCGAPIAYQHFPNTAALMFYPVNRWASFSIPPSGGYTTAGTFTRQLDLTEGLYLEAYVILLRNSSSSLWRSKLPRTDKHT